MQPQVISQRGIILDPISVAIGAALGLHKVSVPRIFAKSMKVATRHVSAVLIRRVGFLER